MNPTVFSREDVGRCGAVAPEWTQGKVYEEVARISYEHVDTRCDSEVKVVAPDFVQAVAQLLDGRQAWKFSGRIDALWGGPEPRTLAELADWLEQDLAADRVIVHSFAGNIADVDAFWFAKESGFDRKAAERLVAELGLA